MSDRAESSGAMWGGRFEDGPDPLFRAVNDSLAIDWRLVGEDIAGSIAWAGALAGAGVLSEDERASLVGALRAIGEEASGLVQPPLESGAEDVHTWVEMRVTDRLGDLGRKLHTGRSRNDQVATDLRLWLRGALDERLGEIDRLKRALLDLAEREIETVMPGYTHLQRAQPILVAHWCLAYCEMLGRDVDRMHDARRRMNRCPLGCGALAGTAYAIDRDALARDLGFDGPCLNSLDAVADRDFVLDALNAATACGLHLSRLAEELVLYCSGEFGFVTIEDAMTSGSSLMPQKKNPDALELVRAKSARLIGHQTAFASLLKALPLAYNKDLQEDKRVVFEAMDELSLVVRVMARLLGGVRFDRERCERAAMGGYANATDLADEIVAVGVPFRGAHEIVGRLVREAMARGVPLEGLALEEIQAACPGLDDQIRGRLTLGASLERRSALGGTSPGRVRAALADARADLGDTPKR